MILLNLRVSTNVIVHVITQKHLNYQKDTNHRGRFSAVIIDASTVGVSPKIPYPRQPCPGMLEEWISSTRAKSSSSSLCSFSLSIKCWTASSVRPERATSLGIGPAGHEVFGLGFDFSTTWALAPPKPKELTATMPPFQGKFLSTTWKKSKYKIESSSFKTKKCKQNEIGEFVNDEKEAKWIGLAIVCTVRKVANDEIYC